MSKCLKIVNELKLKLQHEDNGVLRRLNIIETELKALEIVKEKTTDAYNCLMILKARADNLDYDNYKKLFLTNLTQEEYDLLKEVLE